MVAGVTPLTEMLGVYRRLKEPGDSGKVAAVNFAKQLITSPDDLVAPFTRSVAQFSRYHNPRQFFHKGELTADEPVAAPGSPIARACAPVDPPPPLPPKIRRTPDFARWAKASGNATVSGDPQLSFRYLDRELDCMRTEPGQPLEDGTPSKKALLLDLLYEDLDDGTPILAELKIRKDENPLYGLIQVLAAAAHLVTAAQRARLRNVYGLTAALPRTGGPYLDLYVIFFNPEVKGEWVTVLRHTLALRDVLLKHSAIKPLIRRIEFLHATKGPNGLRYSRADSLAQPAAVLPQASASG